MDEESESMCFGPSVRQMKEALFTKSFVANYFINVNNSTSYGRSHNEMNTYFYEETRTLIERKPDMSASIV